jgi:thiosulfate dehydrogenase (quinone) large subunit
MRNVTKRIPVSTVDIDGVVETMPDPSFVHPELIPAETRNAKAARYVSAVTRISLGTIFLWAFLDKMFGLGHETPGKESWLHGGSPTDGFLAFGAVGPLSGFYHSIAGAAWADISFMIGLLAIGVALITGVAMRLTAYAGGLLLVMMWSVVLPPANHLFMDDHLIYALVLAMLALTGAGATLGLGAWWQNQSLVRRLPILR